MAQTVVVLTTTGPGTWPRPADCPAVVDKVECWDASGGSADDGGGSPGGNYAAVVNLTIGTSVSYTIGAGGTGSHTPTAGGGTFFNGEIRRASGRERGE